MSQSPKDLNSARAPILYVGHLQAGQTSLMRADAMESLGLPLVRFNARAFLDSRSFAERAIGRVLGRSPKVDAMNKALRAAIIAYKPSVIWCDKQEQIEPQTISAMKAAGSLIVFYTPDPYFAQDWLRTSRSDALLSAADIAVTTKSWEVARYNEFCDTFYMPHGYCEQVHQPMVVAPESMVDLGFVGSWEPRRERLMTLAAQKGLKIKIWGYGWDHVSTGKAGLRARYRLKRMSNGEPFDIARNSDLDGVIEARQVLGDDYARAVSASLISPGLLRTTLYPDQHTTRTFEIPACGSMLLAERTAEHEAFFDEDKEAVFFEADEELVEKASYYATHPELQKKIAAAGRQRCISSGYSYKERLRPILSHLAERVPTS